MSTVRAKDDWGFVAHDGVPVLVQAGDEYEPDHPLVQARPELFTEPEPELEPEPKRPTLSRKAAANDRG